MRISLLVCSCAGGHFVWRLRPARILVNGNREVEFYQPKSESGVNGKLL